MIGLRLRWVFAALLVPAFGSLLAVSPARAQVDISPTYDPNLFDRSAAPPDINSIPMLVNIVKDGGKLYYMGTRSGLYGWLIVEDGQVQMVYATADRQTTLIGGMFTRDGDNVTGPQVMALTETNREVANLINGTAKQQQDVMKAGGAGGVAAMPGRVPSDNSAGVRSLPSVPVSPGEMLLRDLQAAAGVTVGHNDSVELMMVMDPNCSHCQATWKALRDSIVANKLQVRMIPLTTGSPENARVAGMLLQAANPFEAFDKYANGDKTALAGEPDAVRAKAISANLDLAAKWKIFATPYLVYRAKDGRIKIVQGEPERIAAVLTDLLQ